MSTASVVAASALAVALAVPLPAAAAGIPEPGCPAGIGGTLSWTPTGAVQGGQQVTLWLDGASVGSSAVPSVTVDSQGVSAQGGGHEVSFSFPLGVTPGTLAIRECGASGTQPISVLRPVIHTATSDVAVRVGGQVAYTAGKAIVVTGTGFALAQGSNALLLDGTTSGVQVTNWSPTGTEIVAVLAPALASGTYRLSIRTGGGTSNATTIHVLSVADAQALAAGKPVSLPWAPGAGGTGGAGSGRSGPSGTGSHAGGQAGSGGSGNPGGGQSGHGVAWLWLVLVGLTSVAAALAALAPWRRRRRVGAGSVQVQTPESEAGEPAAAPEPGGETGPEDRGGAR